MSLTKVTGSVLPLDKIQNPDGYKLIGEVESISLLRAVEPTIINQKIKLKSYYAGLNKGGGDFYYDSTDTTSADDSGMVIVTTNGNRWKRMVDNPYKVNPFYFGAKNNLVDDDIPYIQQAHNYIVSKLKTDVNRRIGGGVLDLSCSQQWNCLSTLTLNLKAVEVDGGRALLDFRNMPDGTDAQHAVAIKTVNSFGYMQDRLKMSGLKLLGRGRTFFTDGIKINDSTSYGGWERNSVHFDGLSVEGFNIALELGTNAYFVSFDHCQFGHNNVGYYFPITASNAGEEINFNNCVFNENNTHCLLGAGGNNFKGCSFDYGYGEYFNLTGGVVQLNECWVEGYGPDTSYIINIPDESPAVFTAVNTSFIFSANNTTVSKVFGFLGNKARPKFDGCFFTKLVSAATSSTTVSGWFDGTCPVVTIKNSRMRVNGNSGSYQLRSRIMTNLSVYDNWLDTKQWTNLSTPFNNEVWLLPPTGGSDTYRVNRYQYGQSESVPDTYDIKKFNGYTRIQKFAASNSTNYQAVIGMIQLDTDGLVTYQLVGSSLASSGSVTLTVKWVKANTYGADQDKTPVIYQSQDSITSTYSFNAASATSISTPTNIQAPTSPPPEWERAPQWATHAILVIDVTNMPVSTELKITDVYMRQI